MACAASRNGPVLATLGSFHPDKRLAKAARKSLFKLRSSGGSRSIPAFERAGDPGAVAGRQEVEQGTAEEGEGGGTFGTAGGAAPEARWLVVGEQVEPVGDRLAGEIGPWPGRIDQRPRRSPRPKARGDRGGRGPRASPRPPSARREGLCRGNRGAGCSALRARPGGPGPGGPGANPPWSRRERGARAGSNRWRWPAAAARGRSCRGGARTRRPPPAALSCGRRAARPDRACGYLGTETVGSVESEWWRWAEMRCCGRSASPEIWVGW